MTIDQKIKIEYEKGTPISAICLLIGRSKSSVLRRARKLGITHPNQNNIRGRIKIDSTSQEANMAQTPTKAELLAFEEHCKANNLPYENWRGFWHKTKEFSSFFVNKDKLTQDAELAEQLIVNAAKRLTNRKPRLKLTKFTGETMLVIPRADDHFGKLSLVEETGNSYNLEEARRRSYVGTQSLLLMSEAFKPKAFAVCIGNDILHIDTHSRTSTAGTPQDTDGTVQSMFDAALESYVTMIDELAEKGDVYLFFVPSNHDWLMGRALAQCLHYAFKNYPNVHTGGELKKNLATRHRKYMKFGENLIMFSHGDGFKEKDGRSIMADEAKKAWAETTFRYIYLGHIHHKDKKAQSMQDIRHEKDYIGFTEIQSSVKRDPLKEVYVEYIRSQSPADGWHDRNGFLNRPAVEAFLHHEARGQMARFTHFF